jgi:hypothetical protein
VEWKYGPKAQNQSLYSSKSLCRVRVFLESHDNKEDYGKERLILQSMPEEVQTSPQKD